MMHVFLLALLAAALSACSGEDQDLKGEHVWQDQTATIGKARKVEERLNNAAKATKQAIEQQAE